MNAYAAMMQKISPEMLFLRHFGIPDGFPSDIAERFLTVCSCDVPTVDWDGHPLILFWVCQDLCSQTRHPC